MQINKEDIIAVSKQLPHIAGRQDFVENLYHQVNKMPDNCRILDIGGFLGGSSIVFALTVKDRGGLVYTINPAFCRTEQWGRYSNYHLSGDLHSFMENITKASMEGYIFPIIGSSEEVLGRWDGRLFDMILIDGDHGSEAVQKDLGWLKYTKENALLFFDDFGSAVKEVALKFFPSHPEWQKLSDIITPVTADYAVYEKGRMEER